MKNSDNQLPPSHRDGPHGQRATVRTTRFSVLWIIPILAIGISGWLAWRHFATQGPVITLSFDTADGLTPGQTQVKNKAVTLGVVRNVTLSPDMSHADVTVQMNARSANYLTDHTRFWVARPRINGASITGLETILSGAYIALDPGEPGGKPQRSFKGLETPPGVRSDKPGSTFWLVTPQLDSLGSGAPVFYRDLTVGEILGYTMPPGGVGPILLKVFVRKPYDRYLRADSHFWNVSGVQIGFGAGGLQVRLQSFQALLSGGVAFGRSGDSVNMQHDTPAEPNSVFRLYKSREEADNTRYLRRLRVATYVGSSVGGLTRGSKVTLFGLQIGTVRDVHLVFDKPANLPRVRIDMELEPGRTINNAGMADINDDRAILANLVEHGLRASVQSVSYLTGEAMVSMIMMPDDKETPAHVTYQEGVAIIPSTAGGMDGIMQSVSTIANKISTMPLEQIGRHVNSLLVHTDNTIKSPELKQSFVALRGSLESLNKLLDTADQHLPQLMDTIQSAMNNARILMAAYGGDTDFHRNLEKLIVELSRMAHSLKQTSDYIDHHPSSLIVGRRK